MSLEQILHRVLSHQSQLQTIYFILNPEYSLLVDQGFLDQDEPRHHGEQNCQKEQKLLSNMDKLVTDFEQWITSEFGKEYCRVQQYCALEQNLQKQQYEVRQHIKMQQQMKIYCQKVCSDFEVLQKSYDYLDTEAESVISSLRKENKKLMQQTSELKKSISDLTHRNSVSSPGNAQEGVLKSLNKDLYVHHFSHDYFPKQTVDIPPINLEPRKNQYKYIYYTPMHEIYINQNRNYQQ